VHPVNAEQVNDRAKLLMHRLIACHLRRDSGSLTQVCACLDGAGANVPAYVEELKAILQNDVDMVSCRPTERSPGMTRLKRSSPCIIGCPRRV
jgi:hypothetical protein